ncbi:hypothetical protein BAL199_00520 [alpha proteobacterium BAL199]|nr:hypothetical protein BAL199_00520 [alpha proteobacterium BAL199]
MASARNNRPSLDDIRAMPVGEIAKLPAEHLALLQEEADAALDAAKRLKEWLEGAIALRYADAATAKRRAEGKDTGLIRFEDGAVAVAADLPKKIEWDQSLLAALVERIRACGENPTDYVDIGFKVPERKYTAWPAAIRETFAAARTVRTAKPTFRLTIKSEDA